jgi:hypothetical protein
MGVVGVLARVDEGKDSAPPVTWKSIENNIRNTQKTSNHVAVHYDKFGGEWKYDQYGTCEWWPFWSEWMRAKSRRHPSLEKACQIT